MSRQQIISQARLAGNEECKVLYNKAKDIVELEISGDERTIEEWLGQTFLKLFLVGKSNELTQQRTMDILIW